MFLDLTEYDSMTMEDILEDIVIVLEAMGVLASWALR